MLLEMRQAVHFWKPVKNLQEGTVYKILKPFFTNDTFQANPKFKILKTKKTLMTKSLTEKEFKKYQDMASEKKET